MIYTLTANPAIDMNITLDSLKRQEVNRSKKVSYSANGKGINVSRTLEYFNIKSTVFGFFGGFSGEYINSELKKCGICTDPVWVNGITRINLFLNQNGSEYTVVNPGPEVNESKRGELLNKIADLNSSDILVISGSLPGGTDDSFYTEILEQCRKNHVRTVLDTSTKNLRELVEYSPFLIKPNGEEAEKLLGLSVKSEEDCLNTLFTLRNMGAENILLTIGKRGAYFSNKNQVYYANTVKVKTQNSACAGDCALGAFLSVWLNDQNSIEPALKRAAAAGANAAESSGTGNFENVSKYEHEITVKRLV